MTDTPRWRTLHLPVRQRTAWRYVTLWRLLRQAERASATRLTVGLAGGIGVATLGASALVRFLNRAERAPHPAALAHVETLLGELAAKADLPAPPLLVLPAAATRFLGRANALAFGPGPRAGLIVIWPSLLEAPDAVLRPILAHELGHLAHRDFWRLGMAQLALVAGLGAALHRAPRAKLFGVTLAAAFNLLAFNAITRAVEAGADVYALDLLDTPAELAGALEWLAAANQLQAPEPALLGDHPPIARRIERARRTQRS
jgi:Zn-dependent protease with chaperone function